MLNVYRKLARTFIDLRDLLENARSERASHPSTPIVHRQTIPRATVEALVRAYGDGESTYHLAQEFGIRRNTVRDILRREGVPITGTKVQSLTEDEKEDVRARFAAGSTRRELADEYAVSESTIRRALKPRPATLSC